MPSKIITTELKEEIVDFYLESPKGMKLVAEKFNLCLPTILKILKEYDIPTYKKA